MSILATPEQALGPQGNRLTGPWTPVLLAAAAIQAGLAIQTRGGLYDERGILLLVGAMICAVAGVWTASTSSGSTRLARTILLAVLAGGTLLQLLVLLRVNPGSITNPPPGDNSPFTAAGTLTRFRLGIALVAAAAAAMAFGPASLRRLILPAILGCHLALGMWIVRQSPSPFIDVFVYQRDACTALLHGHNPYAITFPNLYGPDAYVFGPGMIDHGRLMFGYIYMPLTLLLALPAHALTGDFRYAQVVALTLTGTLLAYARPSRFSALAAVLLLFTPRAFEVLEMGWTDSFVVFMVAATVFCAIRWPKALPVVLGLLLATKQYLILVLPLTVLLMPAPLDWKRWLRMLGTALAVAAAVSAPLILIDIPAFIHSAVVLQFHEPFRPDALSLLAWYYNHFHVKPPLALAIVIGFLAVIPAMVLALRRCPRTPAGFAAAIALVYLAFLLFNKQAFCNYYFFVIGALCCAVAAGTMSDTEQSTPMAMDAQDRAR